MTASDDPVSVARIQRTTVSTVLVSNNPFLAQTERQPVLSALRHLRHGKHSR